MSLINTNETKTIVQETYDKIVEEIRKANESFFNITTIENEMKEFLGQNSTKPEDIKRLAEEVCIKLQFLISNYFNRLF